MSGPTFGIIRYALFEEMVKIEARIGGVMFQSLRIRVRLFENVGIRQSNCRCITMQDQTSMIRSNIDNLK